MAADCAEQAAAVLSGAHLADGCLTAVGEWIVTRRS
jgi:hypothetical protein